MTVWRYQVGGRSNSAQRVLVGIATLGAAAAFAATSLAAPAPAHASACLSTGCGMPTWQRGHGEIGTAEIAHRTPPAESVTSADQADLATVIFSADGGHLLVTAHSRLRLI